jgi:hypothetical protein
MTLRRIVDFERGVVVMDEDEYRLALQRSLCALIHLAKGNGLNDNIAVNQAKELIRCRVLGCGLGGACDGVGSDQYPCPLAVVDKAAAKRGAHDDRRPWRLTENREERDDRGE